MKGRSYGIAAGMVILVSAVALAACRPAFEVDPNATPVAVIDSTIAGFDQTQQALEVIRQATITYYGTQSAGLPDPLTAIPAPFNETVFAAVNAECHFGPGTEYGVVISIFAGESAVILGVDAGGSWFYIETVGTVRCWILSSLVFVPGGTPISSVSEIPVISPPPPPLATLTPTPFPTVPPIIGTPAP